jgi:pantothenate kinase
MFPARIRRHRVLVQPKATISVEEALAEALRLCVDGRRTLLGIAGAPGAGKSTLADRVAARIGSRCRVVPMDGFHLAQAELVRLGRAGRKGAVDTFDVAGYVSLLRRLRDPQKEVVYAPRFDRTLEEPIGSAIPVEPEVELVVTEGNYLLLDAGPWRAVAPLLDRSWFVVAPEEARLRRLIGRHEAHGKSPAAAHAWAHGTDRRNAELAARTMARADQIVLAHSQQI